MPDYKDTDFAATTGAAVDTANDIIVMVDKSNTTMDPTGTNVTITPDELEKALTKAGFDIPVIASPSAPAASTVRLFGRDLGGRIALAQMGPSGLDTSLQPHFGRNRMRCWIPIAGSTTVGAIGCTAPTATGTATNATKATTNLHQFMERVDYLVTTAATSAVAGFRWSSGTAAGLGLYRGNAAKIGGFHVMMRWGPATGVATSTNRAFVGLAAATAAPTDVEPSTQVNCVGMGWDAADTNIQLMHNDASGACTKVDLGASFPVPTSDRTAVYEVDLFCPANSSTISYAVTDLVSDAVASGSISTNLPVNTTAIGPRGYMSVGGTSSVIGIALMGMYVETDY